MTTTQRERGVEKIDLKFRMGTHFYIGISCFGFRGIGGRIKNRTSTKGGAKFTCILDVCGWRGRG